MKFKWNWQLIVIILAILPIAFAGIKEIREFVTYTVLNKDRTTEEMYTRHMATAHLYREDSRVEEEVHIGGVNVSIWAYSDGCVVVRRIEHSGLIGVTNVLPTPEMTEKIKDGLAFDKQLVFAGYVPFDFRAHDGDKNFYEDFTQIRGGTRVVRTYRDRGRCQLTYLIDRHGRSPIPSWQWIRYKDHKRMY